MTITKKELALTAWAEAKRAAEAAAQAATPTPILVGTPTTPFGNDIDPSKPVYYEAGGLCGFAWLTVRPARGALVSLLKEAGIGHLAYGGGWYIGAGDLSPTARATQSVQIKEAAVRAAARVLQDANINATASSRLD